MQSEYADNNADGDDESLFGSPPPSPAVPSDGNCQPKSAQPHLFSTQPQTPSRSASVSSCSSRPPSTASRTVRKKKRSRENSATAHLDQPSIKLPDPNAPLPPNFLRNQQTLLGLAGVVGGINPANLSLQRHTLGSNAQNPIVVEDEHDPPPLGHHSGQRLAPINPSRLPTPSPAQIISTLVNQKNIFPVLDSILKLIASDPPYATNLESPSSIDNGPAKRRRKSEVPAGAADWDAPYPFPSGEGPSNYQADWGKERGKQLISQLIGLIRSAAKKAATKSYVQKHNPYQSLDDVHDYYRSATATYVDPSQPSYNPHQLHSTSTRPPLTPLDQLVSSMFGSDHHSPTSLNTSSTELADLEGLISLLDDAISDKGEPEPTTGTILPSNSSTIPDFLIDPLLLGLSMPNFEQSGANSSNSLAGGSTPALAGSPILSSSSITDPVTPSCDIPVFPELDVTSADPGSASDAGVRVQDIAHRPLDSSSSGPGLELNMPPPSVAQTVSRPTNPNCFDFSALPGVSPQTLNIPIASTSVIPTQPSRLGLQQGPAKRMATSDTSRSTPSISANATRQRREQLIQRANEMRRQLVGEIGKSKVELWEMTIEQGVLAQLAKDAALS